MTDNSTLNEDQTKFGFSEFLNRFTELRYRQSSLKEEIEPVRVVVLVIGIAAVAFLYDDYRLQLGTQWWPGVVYLRLFVSLFSFVVYIALRYVKRFTTFEGVMLSWVVLLAGATIFTEVIRPSDLVYRYGGEEFILILSDSNANQAEQYVKRMRTEMATQNFMPHIPELSVTASIGISEIKEGDTNIRSIFLRADEAVYKAKSEGRDTYRVL